MKISVFGDILNDFWLEESVISKMPIECYNHNLGGNLINICRASTNLFDEIIAIGAVHEEDYNDVYEKFISNKLIPIISKSDKQTGTCILLSKNSIRKNLITIKGANSFVTLTDEEKVLALDSDFLFFTGNLFYPPLTKTSSLCLELISQANNRGQVIFDMLPHAIDKNSMNDEYIIALSYVNILISEVETFNRLFYIDEHCSPVKELGNLNLLLLFDMKQDMGICEKIYVYDLRIRKFSVEYINFDTYTSPKNYLDHVALVVILKHS